MTRTTLAYCTLALASIVSFAVVSVTMAPVITSAGGNNGAFGNLDSGEFSTHIDNPLFPLSALDTKTFEGQETDPDTGELISTLFTSTILNKTRRVGGVEVLVVEEKAYENDELIERALDYYAQHSEGSVYYFGEKVDNYVDGKIDNHEGSWLSGKGDNEPGIIMPAAPFVGQTFKQEQAPGIAEDEATVVALNEFVSTPSGDFTGCLKTEDINPLEEPVVVEFKFHCPGVGLVREDMPEGFMHLTSYTTTEGAAENATSEQINDGGDPISPPAVLAEPDNGEDAGDNGGAALTGTTSPSAAQPAAPVVPAAEPGPAPANVSSETSASGQIDDGAELLPQASITLEQAIAAALSVASGPVGEIDLEHFEGKLVFNVDVGDKDVKIDAQTGAVLSADSED